MQTITAKQQQQTLIHKMGLHNSNEHNSSRVKSFLEDLDSEPPAGCPLAVGDHVIFTNEFGIKFKSRVFGFVKAHAKDNYTPGRVVFLTKESYWFPVPIKSLNKV